MTETATPTSKISMDPRRLPSPLKWGLGVGLLGFFIAFHNTVNSSINGVATCKSLDLAAFAWAVVCVVSAGAGINAYRAVRQQERDATRVMVIVTVVTLAALAVVHVLRGLAILNSPC